ncbi:putative membrane protein [Plasticicumulans lactativorans]|uniref:Putative membrane protein n=1 Tax=Plasticicumulans lactativorans TaxID=1133106 RepID=A0A4R2LDZ9_9GAMM|nr:DUF2069 domain-containing protein [Plasticicumulans lactativorans]TCO81088.1 putative membrane protein [Plasticicumulans lactativorans]
MIPAARWLVLTAWFGLFAFWFARIVWLAPNPLYPVVFLLLLEVGPLLFPLRGLLHGRPYTHAWTAFLALYYVVLAIDDLAGGATDRRLGALALALALALFVGCVVYARLRGRALKRLADGSPP